MSLLQVIGVLIGAAVFVVGFLIYDD